MGLLAKLALPGAAAPFGRPAAVLGAMAVLGLFGALFGGGGESVLSPEGVGAEAMATATSEPMTDEHGDAVVVDEHGDEVVVDEHGDAVVVDEHGDEVVVDEHGDAVAVDEHGDEVVVDEHGDAVAADEHGDEPAADEVGDEPTATPTPEPTTAPTFDLGVTATPSPGDVQWTDFISGEFAVSFKYEVTPDGFLLEQDRTPGSDPVVTWLLTRQSELDSMSSGAAPRGMSVQVYVPDPFPADAEAWVRESSDSHFGAESGELAPVVVGGAQGVRYSWSGSDEVVSAVVQFDARIWVFTSTYREVSVGAFDVLLDSVVFWK